MRRFGPVLATDTLVCLNCGVEVKVSEEEITRQAVITYDGCSTRYVYCSNRCINEGYEFSSTDAENTSHYHAHVMAEYEDEERTHSVRSMPSKMFAEIVAHDVNDYMDAGMTMDDAMINTGWADILVMMSRRGY